MNISTNCKNKIGENFTFKKNKSKSEDNLQLDRDISYIGHNKAIKKEESIKNKLAKLFNKITTIDQIDPENKISIGIAALTSGAIFGAAGAMVLAGPLAIGTFIGGTILSAEYYMAGYKTNPLLAPFAVFAKYVEGLIGGSLSVAGGMVEAGMTVGSGMVEAGMDTMISMSETTMGVATGMTEVTMGIAAGMTEATMDIAANTAGAGMDIAASTTGAAMNTAASITGATMNTAASIAGAFIGKDME